METQSALTQIRAKLWIHPPITLLSPHSSEVLQCCKDSADSRIDVLHLQGEREQYTEEHVVAT